jgi:hypothetical protein
MSGHAFRYAATLPLNKRSGAAKGRSLFMHGTYRMRRWQQAGLRVLLCFAMPCFAAGQTETSTPASSQKPSHVSSPSTSSAKHTTPTKHSSSHTASQKSKTSHSKKTSKQAGKKHGQQAIDPTRARQIQTALIREHYMTGEPSGTWDASTQAAMQRYQADQGWQSKTTPDSRALIKLGLGPSHDHLLNPESAMTMPNSPSSSSPKPETNPGPSEDKLPPQ